MGDVVWSVDPRRDDFASLVARLRRFATDLFEERGVRLAFEVPETLTLPLRPQQRREVYLVLKEAIANAARHAGATAVGVSLQVTEGRLLAPGGARGDGSRT